MRNITVIGIMLGVFAAACSGADGSNNLSGSGGAAATTAMQTATGGVGVFSSTGGVSAQGGAGTSVSTTVGGVSSSSSCPPWPAAKLMPVVGPMFFGPDPGPCSSKYFDASNLSLALMWKIFTYDNEGRLTSESEVVGGGQGTYTWVNGVLDNYSSESASGNRSETYEYGADYVNVVSSTSSVGNPLRYSLAANGYPMSAVSTNATTGEVQQKYTYEYRDCRLQRRGATLSDGTVYSKGALTYEYDEVGHIVRRVAADGSYDEYDYSCW